MKRIIFAIVLIFSFQAAFAQEDVTQLPEKKQQEIEALKVAFISKELDLTPEEAQRFWPVFNQYSKELHASVQENDNVIDREEKVLNIRKKYKEQFTKVLGPDRMNRMFNAEGKFRQMLIKMINRVKQKQMNNRLDRPNRPNRQN